MKSRKGRSDRGDFRVKKKKARRILRPDEKQKSKETIPICLPTSERFYASLLRSEAIEYFGESRNLWNIICNRLALPAPTRPLLCSFGDQRDHFLNRAALVIEEARQALADSITLLSIDLRSGNDGRKFSNLVPPIHNHLRRSKNSQSAVSIEASITKVEHKASGHSVLTFSKSSASFSKHDLLNLRQGTIFSCFDRKTTHTIENIHLGVVLPQNREEMINSKSFAVMIFRKIKKTSEGNWKLTPILSLLSEQRKFEACIFQMSRPVPFLLPLLGRKRSPRTQNSEDNFYSKHKSCLETERIHENDSDSHNDCEVLEFVDLESTFQIPRLNEMQEKAATTFLKSKCDTISLVQG